MPSHVTAPDLGLSKLSKARAVVVLPQPDSPTRLKVSHGLPAQDRATLNREVNLKVVRRDDAPAPVRHRGPFSWKADRGSPGSGQVHRPRRSPKSPAVDVASKDTHTRPAQLRAAGFLPRAWAMKRRSSASLRAAPQGAIVGKALVVA